MSRENKSYLAAFYKCKDDSKSKKKSRIVQCMTRVFKKSTHQSSTEVIPSTKYFVTEAPKSPVKTLNAPILSTWPEATLKTTIGMLLNEKCSSASYNISDIECEIGKVIDETCPFQIPEQYDFCILCAQSDINDAISLKEELNSTFKLSGYTVWDRSLGCDRFFVLEDLLLTSTVILLYISNNFVRDEFCCHVARNVLITPITERARLRVIPVLKDLDTPIPEALQLVDKLVLQNKLRFNFRFSTIFTDSVRLEKLRRQYKTEEDIDTRRMQILSELVKNRVLK